VSRRPRTHELSGRACRTKGRCADKAYLYQQVPRIQPIPIEAGVHEPHLSVARARSGDRWDIYLAEGGEMPLDDALDLALGDRMQGS
jgi:hypothetical protein